MLTMIIGGLLVAWSKKTLITGALTLTAANIITRLIGFAYRIFMADAVGAAGMGLIQLIMPIYSLAWAISCSGITTTLSRLVASEQAKGEHGNMRRLLAISLLMTGTLSLAMTVVLYFGAYAIGAGILNEPRIVMALRILSFSFVFMALGSCLRGYFLGLQKTIVPAVSQIIEQLARIGVIMLLASVFIPRGLEYAAAMAVIGIVLGEFLSCVYVFGAYKLAKRRGANATMSATMGKRTAFFAIGAMALPLTLNRITSSFLSTVENVMIPGRLQAFGMAADEAMAMFGQVTGMAMPLIFFPSAVLVALSISLVPSIAESVTLGENKRVRATITKSITFTCVVAFAAAAIFVVFPYEIGQLVYRQNLAQILLILGLMCPLWYLNITLSGVLSGLGEQIFIFRTSLMASGINIAFVFFLVPQVGIYAFLTGWFISLALVSIFSIRRLKVKTGVKTRLGTWLLKPAIAATLAGLLTNLMHDTIITRLTTGIPALIIALITMMIIYTMCIMLLGIVKASDLKELMPNKKTAD